METAVGTLRKTPLNPVHRELGAKMVAFGGWEMPVEYSGLIAEHMAVRTAAGVFDVSHMGELQVEGPGALPFLQRVTSNNAGKLADGQAQYSALPLPNGAPADDVIVIRLYIRQKKCCRPASVRRPASSHGHAARTACSNLVTVSAMGRLLRPT